MTIKEMVMIKDALCRSFNCDGCFLDRIDDCNNIHSLNKALTPEKEKEIIDWYHKNVNTYINDFCKKFPNADREYVIDNVCCGYIYHGSECKSCDNYDGCAEHWNMIIE